MPVLFVTHPQFLHHDTGLGHPERPQRLVAGEEGARRSGLDTELVAVGAAPAGPEDVERVHSPTYVAALERFCLTGGGNLDADTPVVPASWEAALLAAGAGTTAVERLDAGEDVHRLDHPEKPVDEQPKKDD